MTRPVSSRHDLRNHVNRRARQLEAEGRIARRELPGPRVVYRARTGRFWCFEVPPPAAKGGSSR